MVIISPTFALESVEFPSGYEHNVIGNTWKVNADGDWALPEFTLRWDFIEFASRWYTDQRGNPFVLTDEQLRIALWAYAIDSDGKFLSDEFVLQRLKGWGK